MGFVPSKIKLTSTAFDDYGAIPSKHTGEGVDLSPPLSWTGGTPKAKSYAIICHDPDAPLVKAGTYGFVHWVLYNLPASVTSLQEGTKVGTVGQTDFGKAQYGGPMPPEGHGVHHYYFWVLELDAELDLEPGLTLWQFLEKAEPNIVGMNRLVGTYRRG